MDNRTPRSAESEPGETPPDARRLATPPSARYGATGVDAEPGPPRSSLARDVAVAAVLSLIGAGAIVLLGGVLSQTTGLLAVAGIGGIAVGRAVRGEATDDPGRSMRTAVALILALDMVALGNLGTWAFALSEGGVLGPIEYLLETFGPLVPAEIAVGSIAAWLASR